ncbi:alpha/beta fold hydrolase [Promicromonospora thailandica]|uniref:Pimeloyl-ACP methyl ester carboxylesterase n=1 Tax=Promicromonospora thailandica TaxID=765201 RepID=A0A9X2JZG0_9MICO|nr:alpha/beta hydrolase [Promicromonospora thailandica]MCP2266044.1 Pimeloyl-ACP methyl ester carboxylesterase [Promicromonospora thailandica]BFF21359.1 alpha/beta hydrolase [Promicromonospora thailandica]
MQLVQLSDGRDLEYEVEGPDAGPVVLFHHGMPGSAVPMETVSGSMTERGYRVVTYSRAGYGASSPAPGRTVADTGADGVELLRHLGVARHLVVGWSAGGPHALGSAAAAPDDVDGVLLVAPFAPFDAAGLDYVAGMGAQNVVQFGTVEQGEAAMRALVGQMAAAVTGDQPVGESAELASLLPPPDLAALAGEYGAQNAAHMGYALSRDDEGWFEDLNALTSPWGFDLDAVTAPVELWHGTADQMVPVAHGQWLGEHLPAAVVHVEPGHGHISVAIGSLGEKLDALAARTRGAHA